ncbi:MAG: DUF1673 domain-containing protein [Methanoregula sp.]|jgi:hypothetical protein|nr:DUF1673 domain-containing protein [Methanoregula sp.]
MTRIAEIIHGWLGWCPNAHTLKSRNIGEAGFNLHAGNPHVKSPDPSGANEPGIPRRGKYEHTQRGTLIIGAVSAAIFIILATTYLYGPEWVAIIVLAIMIFVLAIMSTLTVSVNEGLLRIRFGPVGLVRKEWPLSEIVSVTAVNNPWYYGYGLRWTPYGRLYNVSGRGAVEVLLFSGKKFRIGTDEPETLKNAIETALSENKKLTRDR